MSWRGRVAVVVLAAIVLGAVIGGALGALVWLAVAGPQVRTAQERVSARPAPPPPVSRESQDAITAAVARVGPAVVNINTIIGPRAGDRREQLLRKLLGIPTQPFPEKGQGSGFIIDGTQGYVLTNAHVVRGATEVEVSLPDGRNFQATVVGADRLSDVAVVKIPGGDLPAATLGSSEDLRTGSWVIAIGNPWGYENSVTVGVVSAKNRQLRTPDGIPRSDLIQTDASINPGNSGGVLVDLNGNVVGIPTAIIPYAQGIGFALSADLAKEVADHLIATGKMPWLGVTHRRLGPGEVKQLQVPEGKGTLVVAVERNGPAARAGIQPEDVIVEVAGRQIEDDRALGSAIRAHNAGDRVPVVVWRKGREVTVSVTLGEVPQEGFG